MDKDMVELFLKMQMSILERQPHVKKYRKARRIHSEVLNSMIDFMYSKQYDLDGNLRNIFSQCSRDEDINIILDGSKDSDMRTMMELLFYKNLKDVKSITEIYLEKKKFKNEEKVKMLEAMNTSIVGLFKLIKVNKDEGYVTYEDVFTKKRYEVVDLSLSINYDSRTKYETYIYNRLITYDGVTFGNGNMCMSSANIGLKKFKKNHDYINSSDAYRCIKLYDIAKHEPVIKNKVNSIR